jgi:hypothetical protein
VVRTQISFDERQMRRLRQVAKRRGISIAAVVRAAVEREVAEADSARDARWTRALAVMDRGFRSGNSDISERHDDHLAEIYAEPTE